MDTKQIIEATYAMLEERKIALTVNLIASVKYEDWKMIEELLEIKDELMTRIPF